jgi:chemotaxis protein MotB
LLFAFFVVMYAISSVNEGKYRVLSNALAAAFYSESMPKPSASDAIQQPSIAPVMQRPRPKMNEALRRERERLSGIAQDILKVLAPLVRDGKVRVTQTARGVSVEINASVLFAPGDARLTGGSSQALTAVARVLKIDQHAIQVEGHTDNLPINTPLFASNWELSSVRASSVVRLFLENGISESRLTAVGHAAKQPAASNETPEGRSRNRRVTVMILSTLPEAVTEVRVPVRDDPEGITSTSNFSPKGTER